MCLAAPAPGELFTTAESLLTLPQTLPSHSLAQQGNDPVLKRIAHIKRLTALLYLTERLGCSLLHSPFQSISKPTLITSLIESISALPTHNTATLLWPLFVLGNASLENEDHRRFVLDRLADIQQSRNLGSVRRTTEAVKYSFATRELQSSSDGGIVDGDRRIPGWGHERYRFISLA